MSVNSSSANSCIQGYPLTLLGFDICWVGECPWNGGYCFGTEDGRTLFAPRSFSNPYILQETPVSSGEPINGVAFLGDGTDRKILAMSTRSDVTVVESDLGNGSGRRIAEFAWGAHGIHPTTFGSFVAPIGHGGLLLVEPQNGSGYTMRLACPSGSENDFYAMAPLGGVTDQDLFACAARRGGLFSIVVRNDADAVQVPWRYESPRVDFVDACSLNDPTNPRAIASLGLDCSIHFFRDVLSDEKPSTLRFKATEGHAMRGTAYSIRQAGGHLFVLTSEAHYAFPGLVADYFSGEMDRARQIGFSGRPIEAVDIYTAYDQLFLMMPDHVMRIPAEEFSRGQNIKAIVAQIDHRSEDWNITTEPEISFASVA